MNITELKEWLAYGETEDFTGVGGKILSTVGNNMQLTELIESIMVSTAELRRVADSSFVHNLGFTRINLCGWDISQYMVKLHVWGLPNVGDFKLTKQSSIHNHLYDINSKVITGQLDFTIFEECERGDLAMKKYRNPLDSEEYIFDYLGEVRLRSILDIQLPAGGQYLIKHQALHVVDVTEPGMTSTLCVQSPVKSDHTVIYSESALAQTLPRSRVFSPAELTELLKRYLIML